MLNRSESAPIVSWKLLLTTGILIRLAVAIQPYATVDLSTWIEIAETVVDGGDIYETNRVSWTPIWPLTLGALMHISNLTGVYFYLLVRLILLFNDILILLLIRSITVRLNFSKIDSLKAQLFYFLNPLVVIVTIYHPQFGSIAFGALMATCYMTISANGKLRAVPSLILALGTAVKQIILPGIIAFTIYATNLKERMLLLPLTLLVFFFLLSPYYLFDPDLIETKVFGYMSRSGYFGLWGTVYDYSPGLFAELMEFKTLWVLAAFVVSVLAAIWAKSQRKDLPEAIQISFLGFLLLTPGWAIQYLYWLLPFGAIMKIGKKQFMLYSAFGSLAYLEYFYGDWQLNPQLFLPFVYLTMIWWFYHLIKPTATSNND